MDRYGSADEFRTEDQGGSGSEAQFARAWEQVQSECSVAALASPNDRELLELLGLAADSIAAPISVLASEVGGRQVFRVAHGIALREAPLCGSAFQRFLAGSARICSINDPTGSLLLAEARGIQTFIGVRVDGAGDRTGALCIYDHVVRAPLSAREKRILTGVARQIARCLDHEQEAAERTRLDEAQRIAQQAANVGIYISDINGHALCSPEFYQQLGLPLDTPRMGKRWLDAVHPDDRRKVDEAIATATTVTGLFDCDFRVIRADTGEVRWLSSRSRIERAPDGSPLRAIGANIDITDRKRAQAEAEEGRNLLRSVIDQSSDAIFVKDLEHRFILASEKCEMMMGLPADQIVGKRAIDLFDADIAARIDSMDAEIIDQGPGLFEREVMLRGETRILQTGAMPWRRDGATCGLIAISRDITDQKKVERALRESEERFRLAAQAAGLGVWDFDATSGSSRWSDELIKIMGVPAEAEPSRELAERLIHPKDRPDFWNMINAAHSGDPGYRFEATLRLIRDDTGEERWVTTNGWKTLSDKGELSRVIVTVRDVTEEKTAERRIRWTAMHDSLTGLPNRLHFQEEMVAATREGSTERLSLMLLDVDHFKEINDTLGHDAGDFLLRSLGERLRDALRAPDVIARLGGDEFAVILKDITDVAQITDIGTRLLERLREPIIYKGHVLDCRASIGVSAFPDDARTTEDLLKSADTALYMAKAAGRGQMILFRPEMMTQMHRRSTELLLARDALGAGLVRPFYQPKFDLSTGKLNGFEALLRWRGADGNIHLPGEIAAAFDDLEVATALGEAMLDKVVEDIRGWTEQGLRFGHVAVNASAAEFRRPDFAERFLERLARSRVGTHFVELEVTETVFLGREGEKVQRALETLCAAGIKIALDDFGTGYASLSHLKQFPVDTIKIDRSFLRGVPSDSDNAAIVRAVLNLGQSLELNVVAEGIETPAQARFLRANGCDVGQGYLLGRPVSSGRVPYLIGRGDRTGLF